MDKYEQMTDGELRRVVAELLGYTVRSEPNYNAFVLRDANHRFIMSSTWEGVAWNAAPNWPQSADDALALWSDALELTIDIANRYVAITITQTPEDSIMQHFDHFTPQAVARALCVAWLRWRDAQEDGE